MSLRSFALAVAVLTIGTGVAVADKPGADWLTKEQVTQKLKDAGYSEITELEADDGHWEGEGKKDGKMMDFHIDPHSGKFTKEEVDR